MAEIIKMPRLSDTMVSGVIADWKKKVGDHVQAGEVLAEIQTDKATMELESFKSGYLLHRGGENNDTIDVDALLAIIGEKGEDINALLNAKTFTPQEKTDTKQESKDTNNTVQNKEMKEVVIMPRLSDTMESGTIVRWYKKVGDKVKKGELLAEVDTDKATMDLESFVEGTLLYVAANEGEALAVNKMLCIVAEEGTDVNGIIANFNGTPSVAQQDTPALAQAHTSSNVNSSVGTGDAPKAQASHRMKLSPLAKKMVENTQLDVHGLVGSGDHGRIIKKDVESLLKSATRTTKTDAAVSLNEPLIPSEGISMQEGFTDKPASQMRTVIAKRLVESKQQVPHFYLKMEIKMDEMMRQRAVLNEKSAVKISFNDIIIKACAIALRKHPEVNASWINNTNMLRYYHHVHVGSAVAIPDGLIVPVIKHADTKGLAQIAQEAKTLYQKAKDKQLKPHEFAGGNFTISNLGMMDIDEFMAIINPPESCILSVGKIREVVTKAEHGFTVEHRMSLVLSCDHRVVDGAVGAAFLQTLKGYLETPLTIIL